MPVQKVSILYAGFPHIVIQCYVAIFWVIWFTFFGITAELPFQLQDIFNITTYQF